MKTVTHMRNCSGLNFVHSMQPATMHEGVWCDPCNGFFKRVTREDKRMEIDQVLINKLVPKIDHFLRTGHGDNPLQELKFEVHYDPGGPYIKIYLLSHDGGGRA